MVSSLMRRRQPVVLRVPEKAPVVPATVTGPEWVEEKGKIARVDPGTTGSAGQRLVVMPGGQTAWRYESAKDVTDPRFGAIGDGVADDTAAINAALTGGGHIIIPDGTYKAGNLPIDTANTQVTLSPGARFVSTAYNLFAVEDIDNFVLNGNGAEIDLNGVTNRAVFAEGGSGDLIQRLTVRDLVVHNRPLAASFRSAFEIAYVDRPTIENVDIYDYGYSNTVGQEVYGIGVLDCIKPRIVRADIWHGYIGVLIDDCLDASVDQFTVTDVKDNGVYILSGSDRTSIARGTIDDAEEGVVILSPNTTVDQVQFLNNTNKGLVLRNADHAKITRNTFNGCATSIGDDGTGTVSERVQISGNDFIQATGPNIILLIALEDSEITGNDFLATGSLSSAMVRLNNAKRVKVNGNRFEDETGALIALRYSHASDYCEASYNTFVKAGTGISLFTSGSGPSNTRAAYNNYHAGVTTPYTASGGLTGNTHVTF